MNYCIEGYASNVEDGETITLARSPDGISLEILSQSVVEDGRFCLKGYVENCRIGYICCNAPQKNSCTMFFMEKGDLEAVIDSLGCRITGTSVNELASAVEDSINHYVLGMETIEELCCSTLPDSARLAQLGIEGLYRQEMLVDYLKRTVNENIGNLLGLYMLVVYSELFTDNELLLLKEMIPPSSIDRDDNPLYDVLTEILQVRQSK